MKIHYSIRHGEPLNLDEVNVSSIRGRSSAHTGDDIGCRFGNYTYRYPRHLPTGLSRSSRQNRLLRLSARTARVQECPIPQRLASQKVTQIHLDTIRRQLEHRLQVAKASQKNSLVTLLESEFQQLDCHANVGAQ